MNQYLKQDAQGNWQECAADELVEGAPYRKLIYTASGVARVEGIWHAVAVDELQQY